VSTDDRRQLAEKFQELHRGPKLLTLPNVWEVAGARVFEEAGFDAIGTTSRGVAASHGYPDGEAMAREEMLAVVKRIADSVSIPVTADMEAGYGATPEAVAQTAAGVIDAGAVGINVEDGRNIMGDRTGAQLADLALQIEKLRAIRDTAATMSVPIVINARTDVFWLEVGEPEDRLAHAVERGNAYVEAGADCLFVPGVKDRDMIARLVDELNGPINVLAVKGSPPIRELEEIGVARVSLGSGPYRATLALLKTIASELTGLGTYRSFTEESVRYGELIDALAREGETHIDYPSE